MAILQTSSTDAELGDAVDILGGYRRRLVLAVVSEADDALPLATLARELAAAQQGVSPDAVTDEHRSRTEVRLHHSILPPLSAAGLLRYDQQRGVVTGAEMPLEGEEWLEMPVVEALEAWNDR